MITIKESDTDYSNKNKLYFNIDSYIKDNYKEKRRQTMAFIVLYQTGGSRNTRTGKIYINYNQCLKELDSPEIMSIDEKITQAISHEIIHDIIANKFKDAIANIQFDNITIIAWTKGYCLTVPRLIFKDSFKLNSSDKMNSDKISN